MIREWLFSKSCNSGNQNACQQIAQDEAAFYPGVSERTRISQWPNGGFRDRHRQFGRSRQHRRDKINEESAPLTYLTVSSNWRIYLKGRMAPFLDTRRPKCFAPPPEFRQTLVGVRDFSGSPGLLY